MSKDKKKEYLTCISCGKEKEKNANYYNTKSQFYALTGKIPLCKTCVKKTIDYNNMETVYSFLRQFDIMFDFECWESAVNSKMETMGRYMSMSNSLTQFEGKGWNDSVFKKKDQTVTEKAQKTTLETFGVDQKVEDSPIVINHRDRDDVVRMLGFDPFEHENPRDRNQLY